MNEMCVVYWWNDTDRGKTEVLGEKPVPLSTLSAINPTCALGIGELDTFNVYECPQYSR